MIRKIIKNLPFTDVYRKFRDKSYYKRLGKSSNVSPYGFNFYGEAKFSEERENNDIKLLKHFFNYCEVFLDVGANIGYYSLLARQSGLEVIAFEPIEDNCRLINKSIQDNKFNIELHQIALANYVGTTKIYGGRQGGSLLKGWGNISKNYYSFCKVDKLDNVLEGRFLNHKVLLKIDAEGLEYEILKGSENLLRQNNNVILYIENGFKENFGGEINPNFKNVFEFLFLLDYKCFIDIDLKIEIDINIIDNWIKNDKIDLDVINYIFLKNHSNAPKQNG